MTARNRKRSHPGAADEAASLPDSVQVTREMLVYDALALDFDRVPDFFRDELQLKCWNCVASTKESFAQAACLHPFDVDDVLRRLNDWLATTPIDTSPLRATERGMT